MGSFTNTVIKGERIYSKGSNILFLIIVALVVVLVIYTGLQSDKNLHKISDGDDKVYKSEKIIKKFALPIIVILILSAYANNYVNKKIQSNNKFAAISGAFNIGNFIGNGIFKS